MLDSKPVIAVSVSTQVANHLVIKSGPPEVQGAARHSHKWVAVLFLLTTEPSEQQSAPAVTLT